MNRESMGFRIVACFLNASCFLIPMGFGLDFIGKLNENVNYGPEKLKEIKEVIKTLDESQLPNLNFDNDIIINDVVDIGVGKDKDDKFRLDVVGSELGTPVQYKFSYELKDDIINDNVDVLSLLSNIDGYVTANKFEQDKAILKDKKAMDFYTNVVVNNSLVEISKAEPNQKFEIIASSPEIQNYSTYDIKENSKGELYAVPYEMKGPNMNGYSM